MFSFLNLIEVFLFTERQDVMETTIEVHNIELKVHRKTLQSQQIELDTQMTTQKEQHSILTDHRTALDDQKGDA